MSDEGFREIQLNGKQLVFLFMAATVVSVVIFLCGVLVGRGVRGTDTSAAMSAGDVVPDSNRQPPPQEGTAPPNAAQSGAPSAAAETPSSAGELTYAERLLRESPPEENLKERAPAVQEPVPAEPWGAAATPPAPASAPASPRAAAEKPTATPQATPVEKPTPAGTAAKSASATSVPTATATSGGGASDPSGPGFAVQVSIFDSRQEADRLANQLIAKGYPAFVVDPAKGARGIYRVRVGKYRNRKDAEAASARLEKNEQFKPWIAR